MRGRSSLIRPNKSRSIQPVSVPLDPSVQLLSVLTETVENNTPVGSNIQKLYQRMVGKLMYAMIGTRPNPSFAVATLAKFSPTPTAAHLAACKWVVRYLWGTSSIGIMYGGASFCIGFTDSDYAGDRNNRRSTSRYVFMLYGGAISWIARQQTLVALSSTEAEYVAATEACKASSSIFSKKPISS